MIDLTPVEYHKGLWIKREDLYRYPNGANGSKLRAAEQLLKSARDKGFRKAVTAAACVSPQHALVSSAATKLGMETTHILGGTNPLSSLLHSSVRIAAENGAAFKYISVGYNPALVKAAREWVDEHPDTYWLHYGISPAPDADEEALRAFHAPSAIQTQNVPESVTQLVVPFGSGNTGAGILLGLKQNGFDGRVHLMCIGPDRKGWLRDRFAGMNEPFKFPFEITYHELFKFAKYGDRMPEEIDGVTMHPTYEGKVVRYLNLVSLPFWEEPADRTMLWVVGAPIPRLEGSSS